MAKPHASRLDARSLVAFFGEEKEAILVEVASVEGSAPRGIGALMLVGQRACLGTIGGGRLEYEAVIAARAFRKRGGATQEQVFALGPSLGQCCGGRVVLSYRRLDSSGESRLMSRLSAQADCEPEVWVFGCGHLGAALLDHLVLLPFRPKLVETREAFCTEKNGVDFFLTALPESLIAQARPGSAFVVLTHDHALDFQITKAALSRGDAAYVGMIGSQSKAARFRRWSRDAGLAQTDLSALRSPMAKDRTRDRRPEVIACLIAAELTCALAASPL